MLLDKGGRSYPLGIVFFANGIKQLFLLFGIIADQLLFQSGTAFLEICSGGSFEIVFRAYFTDTGGRICIMQHSVYMGGYSFELLSSKVYDGSVMSPSLMPKVGIALIGSYPKHALKERRISANDLVSF